MNFKDYCRLRDAEEEVLKRENNVIKIEYTEFSDEYRQIDEIILEFHNEFYVFDSMLNKFNTFILLVVSFFLLTSFVGMSFLFLSIASYDFIRYFFVLPFGIDILANIFYINIGITAFTVILFSFLLFLRDKGYQSSYYQRLLKIDNSNNEYSSKGFSKFREFKVRDYRMHWVKCLFTPKDIEYVFKIYNNYINYKDDLDQAVSIKSFLSNKFIKGIFAIFTTGAIGFLASYNANIQSKNSDFFSKNPQFFFNSVFMVFYSLLFIFLTYFMFYLLKDFFFNFIDFFRRNSEVTEVRKKRLVYYIHQSRVLRVKGKYGKSSNNTKSVNFER